MPQKWTGFFSSV